MQGLNLFFIMKITQSDLHEIFFHNSNIEYANLIQQVEETLNCKLNVDQTNFVKRSFKSFKSNKDRWFTKKRIKLDYELYRRQLKRNLDEREEYLEIEEQPILEEMNLNSSSNKSSNISHRKVFDELSRKQQLERTKDIWSRLKLKAEEEEIEIVRLLGFLLTRCSSERETQIGKNIFEKKDVNLNSTIPVITALTIYSDCQLGRETYTKQRRLLAAVGHPIFPAWRNLRNLQEEITPPIQYLSSPNHGVYFPFLKSLEMTMVRILDDSNLEINQLYQHQLKLKYGFDGSGSHGIYRQKNNAQTNNMILTVMCPLKLTKIDSTADKIWEEISPNSPLTQRPLMLQLGKERES